MNKQQLWQTLSQALSSKVAEQPVKNANSGNDLTQKGAPKSKNGQSFTKMKPKAGNPHKQYSVAAINKAKASIG